MLWMLMVFGCQDEPEGSDGDDTPVVDTGGVVDTDAPGACASETLGLDGGRIEADGATLEVPALALFGDELVELCSYPGVGLQSAQWVVGPSDLAFDGPLWLDLAHDGDEVTTAMFTAAPGGGTWRSLQATRPGAGTLLGPMWRPGDAWVAAEGRLVTPYEPGLGGGKLDLLFVIDNSCSMYDEQVDLISYFPDVVSYFDGSGLDYHVGVVSTDLDDASHSGRLREAQGLRWIDPSTPNPQQVFESMATMGTAGSGTERGLGAAYLALEALRDSYNAGFVRDDATLGIVVLSDENDMTQTSLITPAEFVDWLDGYKPDPDATALHGIVSPPGGIYSGQVYLDVALATGGLYTPVGDSSTWGTFLEDVALSMAEDSLVGMALAAAPGTEVEAWVVPADTEQGPVDAGRVDWDDAEAWLSIDTDGLPEDEIQILYVPE